MKFKMLLIGVLLSSMFASANEKIGLWRPTEGISEAEAYALTVAGIKEFLANDEDGEVCGVDDVWALTMESPLKPGRPERGEIFAITAYARGPYMGCSVSKDYDCRVVFNRPPQSSSWQMEYTECEPLSSSENGED